MIWTSMPVGKYKGKTLPQLVFRDPDYFFWAHKAGVFQNRLADEAEFIFQRATRIRVPPINGGEFLVEYVIHKPTGTLGTLKLINKDDIESYFHTSWYVSPVIDLSFPRKLKHYDKGGYN